MFVKMWMSTELVTAGPDLPILDARNRMKERGVRRLPVIHNGQLVGVVTEGDIQEASPSDANSLSVWELNYLLAKTTVEQIMTPRRDLSVVAPGDPIEKAALLMRERKVSGLPVLDDDALVGIVTESDLFGAFLNVLGATQPGARLTLAMKNTPGALLPVLKTFKALLLNVLSLPTCDACLRALPGAGRDIVVVMHIEGYDPQPLVAPLRKLGVRVLDARS